jgi:type I restriction enzyme M protein
MALKKSELYSSLWASCDALRGGMDAGHYKDYVLVLLFIKYISDKYAGQPYAPVTVPKGSSFADMVALKGKPDIGDQIKKKIVAPLATADKLSDMPDFNDATKLGSGKEMVDRLTPLIAIFEDKRLDFSKNRAEGDDIHLDMDPEIAVLEAKLAKARRVKQGMTQELLWEDPARMTENQRTEWKES